MREEIPSPREEDFIEYTLPERLGQAARGYGPGLVGMATGFAASGSMIGAGIGMTLASIAAGAYRVGSKKKLPGIELDGYAAGAGLGVFWTAFEVASDLFVNMTASQ